jgi:hypothetical protein
MCFDLSEHDSWDQSYDGLAVIKNEGDLKRLPTMKDDAPDVQPKTQPLNSPVA